MELEQIISIKRIAGLPGDVMEWDEKGHLTRNGETVAELEVIYGGTGRTTAGPAHFAVPEESCFYLGDNRPVSLDNRYEAVGCAQREEIRGIVIAAYKIQYFGDTSVI